MCPKAILTDCITLYVGTANKSMLQEISFRLLRSCS